MTRRIMMLTALAATATAAIAASPATAQSWYGYGGYRDAPRYDERYERRDYDRRDGWAWRQRWDARRDWARRDWNREDARRSYWQQERGERRWRDHEEDEERD